ncbi:MAG: hypothetical protein R3F43_04430 [bacterium]
MDVSTPAAASRPEPAEKAKPEPTEKTSKSGKTAPAKAAEAPAAETGPAEADDWFVETTEQLEAKHARLSVYHFQEEKERSLFPYVLGALVVLLAAGLLIYRATSDDAPAAPDAAPVVTNVGGPPPDAARPAPDAARPVADAAVPERDPDVGKAAQPDAAAAAADHRRSREALAGRPGRPPLRWRRRRHRAGGRPAGRRSGQRHGARGRGEGPRRPAGREPRAGQGGGFDEARIAARQPSSSSRATPRRSLSSPPSIARTSRPLTP